MNSKTDIEPKDECCGSSPADAATPAAFSQDAASGHQKSIFKVKGMDCADEVNAIQKALVHAQVSKVEANLISSKVTVFHDPSLSVDEIRKRVSSAGVTITEESADFFNDNSTRLKLVGASGAFLLTGFLLDWLLDASIYANIAFGLAALCGGVIVAPKAFRAAKSRSLDMNVLMVVAAVGAFCIGEFSEGATVVCLFSLAELLEAFSVARARRAIQAVLELTPPIASVETEGKVESIPVEQIKPGQTILIKAGERIALDGTVTRGESSVNQAPLTGESVPVIKAVGDKVFAGTVNQNGALSVEVTKGFYETKLAKVISLIEDAQKQKAPSQRFVDQFARIYTPAVFVVALATLFIPPLFFEGEWAVWVYRALVFLVIACPCALVIATPVSIVSGLTALAKRGVLVKGGTFLETLGKMRALAVDKTGTITEGKPKVQSVRVWGDGNEKELLDVAVSLESVSTHPLALAVMAFGEQKGSKVSQVSNYEMVPGRGAKGEIGEGAYFLGNHKFAHELGVCTTELEVYLSSLEEKAQSVIVVGRLAKTGDKGGILGVFGLGDTIRPEVKASIAALHRAGIEHIVMLSGDNQKTATAIAAQVGIEEANGDMLPEDKVNRMKALLLKYHTVGMIGDGVNDAPALAQASVGIAMGAAGSDAAIETADIALMKDDLSQVAVAIVQGRRALNVIRFNIVFALAIKVVFLGFAFMGHSNLWLAVAADTGASLFVTFNALRLLKV